MEKGLDQLIAETIEVSTAGEVTRGLKEAVNIRKPLEPEPGEPPLIREGPLLAAGQFRRRIAMRQAATDRRLSFARALVQNEWDTEKAMRAAGYNPSPLAVKSTADSLINHPDVIEELRRIRSIVEAKTDAATVNLTEQWIAIASSNIFDAFNEVEREDGVVRLTLKSKKDIPAKAQRAIKAIKIRRRKQSYKDVEIETEDIEVLLWDKQAALDSLAKLQGLYQDRKADAINNLASKIAERTERARRKIGNTFEG